MYSKFSREILNSIGGIKKYDLNKYINDSSDDISNLLYPTDLQSNYFDIEKLIQETSKFKDRFLILNLNTESIRSKFDTLLCLVDHLKSQHIEISAIALQETWLNEDTDTDLFKLPGYNLISQGSICSTKGGLFIYLHKRYDYTLRNLYSRSIWYEALYVDVTSNCLNRTITIGNIYRPPRENNNNNSVRHFISEITPIIHKLGREKSDTIICGDFNINILKVNERDIFAEFIDLFLNNGFLPQISLPTRFSKKNATLIDQIFCKFSNAT